MEPSERQQVEVGRANKFLRNQPESNFQVAHNLTGTARSASPMPPTPGRRPDLIRTELRSRSVAATIRVSESGVGLLTVLHMEPADHRTVNLENSPAGIIQPVEDCLLHRRGKGIERQGCLQLERVFIPQASVDLSGLFYL